MAPEISYKVLEYNHYTMKGDIARKKETVRILADQLEPKRADLTAINKELASNVFFMFNNMNIRHNNSTEGDKNYREVVAKMTQDELEIGTMKHISCACWLFGIGQCGKNKESGPTEGELWKIKGILEKKTRA